MAKLGLRSGAVLNIVYAEIACIGKISVTTQADENDFNRAR